MCSALGGGGGGGGGVWRGIQYMLCVVDIKNALGCSGYSGDIISALGGWGVEGCTVHFGDIISTLREYHYCCGTPLIH